MFQRMKSVASGVLGAPIAVAVLAAGLAASPATAVEIGVANYGSGPPGFPYAVALAKGFFKEAGVDITAIRGSQGGGSDIRIMLAGELAFFEGTVGPIVTANQKGADFRLVSTGQNNTTNQWIVMPDSPIKSFADLKGKKVGYTNAQSQSQALLLYLLKKYGYKDGDVEMVSTNGFGPGPTLLEKGAIDVAVITEPVVSTNKGKYRVILNGNDPSVFAPANNTMGFVSEKYAKANPGVIKAIIEGRRKGVEFIYKNPKESAEILAKQLNLPVDIMLETLERITTKGTIGGVQMFSLGNFDVPSLNESLGFARLVGVIEGDVDITKMLDDSYLPADLKSKK